MAVNRAIPFNMMKKLRDLLKEIGSSLDPQVEQLAKRIEQLHQNWDDEKISVLSYEFMKAVYAAEDNIEVFLIESRKESHQQDVGVKLFSDVIPVCSFIQARKMKKLVDDIEKELEKCEKAAAEYKRAAARSQINSTEKDISEKKTGTLNLKGEEKELAELIINSDESVSDVWVVDVAGSARTTELWKMYERKDVKKHFPYRAWVQVSQQPEKEKLLFEILNQVRGPVYQDNISKKGLYNLLKQQRYLIVLIDVRTPDIWEILKSVFPISSNGGRVILSFQEADAARCQNIRFLGGEFTLNPRSTRLLSDTIEDDAGNDVNTPTSQVSDGRIKKEETEIVGMKDEILKLARPILNGGNKYFLISVAGVAGSGKTTLVKTIYNSSYTRQNFGCQAWVNVYVSYDFDTRKVLRNILAQITKYKVQEDLAVNELERKLIESLREKRYLVVLDDVYLPGVWNEIGWIFSSTSSSSGGRSRVILITRDTNVARSFSPSIFLHHLRPLNENESAELLSKKVPENRGEKVPEKRGEILERCSGLPLAICVLGSLLSTNQEQSNALDALDALDTLDASSTWRLGYAYLSSNLKAILSYLYLFPESYDIPVRRLHHLLLAEKLATPTEQSAESTQQSTASTEQSAAPTEQSTASTQQSTAPTEQSTASTQQSAAPTEKSTSQTKEVDSTPEDQAKEDFKQRVASKKVDSTPEDQVKEDFKQLVARNMIEVVKRRSDGRPKIFRVPNTLYDTIRMHANIMGSFHNADSQNLPIRRLSENKPPSEEHFECLHSYISFDTRKRDKPAEEVKSFLKKTITKRSVGLLRVLDLEGVHKPVLPESLGKLRLLRYVGLRWTFLDSIPPSVGDLPSLETLDVKHTNITTLPSSIWKARKLRHLYMNEIGVQKLIQKSVSRFSLTNLQTLWGLLIGNEKLPQNLLDNVKFLRKLGLTFHTNSLEEITNWIKQLTSLECLRLRSIKHFHEPSYLNFGSFEEHQKLTELYLFGKLQKPIIKTNLPQNLKILTLSLSHLSKDPIPELENLKELNILRLFAHSYMGEEMTCHAGGFPKLQVLKLWKLKELKDWNIQEEAMPSLRELEIRNCGKLKNPIGLEKVKTLKELTLTNMKKIETEVRSSLAAIENIVIYSRWDEDAPGGKDSE